MSVLTFRFFGTGQLQSAAGETIPIRSRKRLALLAYLLMENGHAHSRELLMALFWADHGIDTARNNLRVTLSNLRKLTAHAVGTPSQDDIPQRSSGSLILSNQFDVGINPEADYWFDVAAFGQHLRQTQTHLHPSRGNGRRSECAECQPLLEEAVSLYQSEFLAGLALDDCPEFEEWLFMQRERHHLLALDASADLAAFAEAEGTLDKALGFTQQQIALDPLRESAYRQQMRIQAKRGDRNQALVTFRRCRTILQSELGIDPERETQSLHEQILNAEASHKIEPKGDLSVKESQIDTMRGAKADETPRHNLSQRLTPFIGREKEIEQLHIRLVEPDYRLITLVGPGGVGKSRLAQEVAAQHLHTFRDGVYFVPLAGFQTAASIPGAIVNALGLTIHTGEQSHVDQLIEVIGRRRLLLILDNFEHLLAGGALPAMNAPPNDQCSSITDGVELVLWLLTQTPNVVLMVTSRECLNVQPEDLFVLGGLPIPNGTPSMGNAVEGSKPDASSFASVRLFAERAHRLDKSFKLTQQALPHVVQICQRVDGFPLGIELAATWIRDLSCAEIARELDSGLGEEKGAGLDLLETTLRDIEPQHRSLRSVFNSSWQLLSRAEQQALAALSIFRGGFTSSAARSVAGSSPIMLSSLRNKSLLRNAGERRYDMHSLIQQFAAEYLALDPQGFKQVRQAHGETYMKLLADNAIALDTREARVVSEHIQADWENIRLAWQWLMTDIRYLEEEAALVEDALDAVVRFCNLRGLFQDAQNLLSHARSHLQSYFQLHFDGQPQGEKSESKPLILQSRLLGREAYFAERLGHFEQAKNLLGQALEITHRIDSQAALIDVYLVQANAHTSAAEFVKGRQVAEEALKLAQQAELELEAGLCMVDLGFIHYQLGNYEEANEHLTAALAIHEKTGRIELRSRNALGYLSNVASDQSRYDVTLRYGQLYLESCQAMADRRSEIMARHYLAINLNILGYYQKAVELENEAARIADAIGARLQKSFVMHTKADLHRRLGQLEEAADCAIEAVALARDFDAPLALAYALEKLADVQTDLAEEDADWSEAEENYKKAAEIFYDIGQPTAAHGVMIGLAKLFNRRQEFGIAQKYIEPLLTLLPTVSADGWWNPANVYMVCIHTLQAAHDVRFEALLQQGKHLLDSLAQNIEDPRRRHHFLNAVPANRELYRIYAEFEPSSLTSNQVTEPYSS